jgi:hypothetical protein
MADSVVELRDGRVLVANVQEPRIANGTAGDSSSAQISIKAPTLLHDRCESLDPLVFENRPEVKHDWVAPHQQSMDMVSDKTRQRGDVTVYSYYAKSAGYKAFSAFASFMIA